MSVSSLLVDVVIDHFKVHGVIRWRNSIHLYNGIILQPVTIKKTRILLCAYAQIVLIGGQFKKNIA